MSRLFELPTKGQETGVPTPAVSVIAPAESVDLVPAMTLLLDARLPLDGLVEHFGHFLVARATDASLAGLIGVELYGSSALIRSVAVAPLHRRGGLGRRLVEAMIVRAKSEGVRTLYLLTERAVPFFRALGFDPVDRTAVEAQVLASSQFLISRCAAAICLKRTI